MIKIASILTVNLKDLLLHRNHLKHIILIESTHQMTLIVHTQNRNKKEENTHKMFMTANTKKKIAMITKKKQKNMIKKVIMIIKVNLVKKVKIGSHLKQIA